MNLHGALGCYKSNMKYKEFMRVVEFKVVVIFIFMNVIAYLLLTGRTVRRLEGHWYMYMNHQWCHHRPRMSDTCHSAKQTDPHIYTDTVFHSKNTLKNRINKIINHSWQYLSCIKYNIISRARDYTSSYVDFCNVSAVTDCVGQSDVLKILPHLIDHRDACWFQLNFNQEVCEGQFWVQHQQHIISLVFSLHFILKCTFTILFFSSQ